MKLLVGTMTALTHIRRRTDLFAWPASAVAIFLSCGLFSAREAERPVVSPADLLRLSTIDPGTINRALYEDIIDPACVYEYSTFEKRNAYALIARLNAIVATFPNMEVEWTRDRTRGRVDEKGIDTSTLYRTYTISLDGDVAAGADITGNTRFEVVRVRLINDWRIQYWEDYEFRFLDSTLGSGDTSFFHPDFIDRR